MNLINKTNRERPIISAAPPKTGRAEESILQKQTES